MHEPEDSGGPERHGAGILLRLPTPSYFCHTIGTINTIIIL